MKKNTLNIKSLSYYTIMTIVIMVSATYASSLSKINVDSRGLAIEGYDTVAYFTMGKPVVGKGKYRYQWEDTTWLFSSEEHLNLFKKAPEKYIPQYGGY